MPKKMKMSTIFMECSYSIAESKLNYKYEQIISMKDNLLFFFLLMAISMKLVCIQG